MIPAFPLEWPAGWQRTKRPTRSRFGDFTLSRCLQGLFQELDRLRASEVVISTNVELRLDGLPYSGKRAPDDPGVAVYFKLRGEATVLACDSWDTVAHNLRAVMLHIDALRGMHRWGVGTLDRAFTGYKALPPPPAARSWRAVLGLDVYTMENLRAGGPNVIAARYRALAKLRHPDTGGSAAQFAELGRARDEALEELKR